jgi:hypothetical protein
MTAQEQQMLQGLTERINQTQLPEKDPDAEQYIQQGLGRNPDALYVMAQTILVQQYALDQAQKQLADLKAQLQQAQEPKHTTSFLGSLLGRHDDPVRPAVPQAPPQQQYGQQQYAPVPGYVQAPGYAQAPGYGAPGYGQPGFGAPQGGGFLRGAMQTAAGVAAGALAFEGVESLMHGFGHSAGYGSGLGGFDGGGRPEEIVNNYYGDSAPHEHGGGLSSDIEDRRGESQFSNAVDGDRQGNVNELDATQRDTNELDTGDRGFDDNANVAGDDGSSGDDSGGGNDFADDSSSFDDGGGSDFDSGGGDSGGGDGGF